MVLIRRQGNLRPAGGGRAGSGRRWRGRSRHPCGAPPAAPGGSRHQLLALPGGPARGARLGPPPHPGRDPEAVSRGSRRVPGDTERRREGRRARLCERSPSGGRGTVLLPRCGPGVRAAKQRDLSKERSSRSGSAHRRGEPAPPRGPGRGMRGVPFPGRTMAVRKSGRFSSPPGASLRDAFACSTYALAGGRVLPSPPACGAAPLWDCTEAWEERLHQENHSLPPGNGFLWSLQGQPGLSLLPDPAESAWSLSPSFSSDPAPAAAFLTRVLWYRACSEAG